MDIYNAWITNSNQAPKPKSSCLVSTDRKFMGKSGPSEQKTEPCPCYRCPWIVDFPSRWLGVRFPFVYTDRLTRNGISSLSLSNPFFRAPGQIKNAFEIFISHAANFFFWTNLEKRHCANKVTVVVVTFKSSLGCVDSSELSSLQTTFRIFCNF